MADDPNQQLPLDPNRGGNIQPINIEEEMRRSYLDYSMSVIIGRALPDVRDGLKPVHRRILYAMHDMGLLHNRKHVKCAKVVGEVLGKYHPHGDTAVYDAMVGMATKIPPHNLTEIVDACITLVNNPKATLADVMQFVQGPDFPTGGFIHG